jgi:hypothetical protein
LFLGTVAVNNADMVSKGRQAKGEEARHKLTTDQVREIKALCKIGTRHQQIRDTGVGTYVLARRFGVTPRTIRLIVKGKSWKHV